MKVLGLSFDKGVAETGLFEFEKLVVYGVMQLLNHYTNIEFVDCAVPANRMMIRALPMDVQRSELRQMAARNKTQFILYGEMKPQVEEEFYLGSVQLVLNLYDAGRDAHCFHILQFPFSEFEGARAKTAGFTPGWDGLQDLIRWTACQVVAALRPEISLYLWDKIKRVQLADSIMPFQKLANAHYLNGDNSMAQKLSLLSDLTQDHPDMFLAYLELGMLHKRMQNYALGIVALEWAFKLMKEATPKQKSHLATEIVAFVIPFPPSMKKRACGGKQRFMKTRVM